MKGIGDKKYEDIDNPADLMVAFAEKVYLAAFAEVEKMEAAGITADALPVYVITCANYEGIQKGIVVNSGNADTEVLKSLMAVSIKENTKEEVRQSKIYDPKTKKFKDKN